MLNLNLYDGTGWTLYTAASRDNVNNFVNTGVSNVIFNQATLAEVQLVPVTLTNLKAYQKNKGVQVEWRAEQELNIDSYEAERSQTGNLFKIIGKVTARDNNGGTVNYDLFDPAPESGVNFYRIKIINKSGEVKYSAVVKVNIGAATGTISVYPNPVTGNSIALQLSNMPGGRYTLILTNAAGQRIAAKAITHSGGSAAEMLELPQSIAPGVYQLSVTGGERHISVQVIKR